jgi:hypothetical protein
MHSLNIIETQPTPDSSFKASSNQPFIRIGNSTRVHSTEQLYEFRPEETLFQHRTNFEMKRKQHPTAIKIDLDSSFYFHQSPEQQQPDFQFFLQKKEAASSEPQPIEKDESQASSKSHGLRSTGTRYKVFYRHLKRLSTNRQSRCKRMTAAVHYEQVVEDKADGAAQRQKRLEIYLEKLARTLVLPPTGG